MSELLWKSNRNMGEHIDQHTKSERKMRIFKCMDCGCTFRILFGEGYPGCQPMCPNCRNLHAICVYRKPTWKEKHLAMIQKQNKNKRFVAGRYGFTK